MSQLALFDLVAEDLSDDAQCTPRDLALELGWFGTDPCSNPRSHIQAIASYMLERAQDGLASLWDTPDPDGNLSVFCNGPYSNPLPWCERLRAHRGPVCSLWKLDPTTRWFAELMHGGFSWGAFKRRLAFEKPGNAGNVAKFPCVLAWRDWTLPTAVRSRLWLPGDVLSTEPDFGE